MESRVAQEKSNTGNTAELNTTDEKKSTSSVGEYLKDAGLTEEEVSQLLPALEHYSEEIIRKVIQDNQKAIAGLMTDKRLNPVGATRVVKAIGIHLATIDYKARKKSEEEQYASSNTLEDDPLVSKEKHLSGSPKTSLKLDSSPQGDLTVINSKIPIKRHSADELPQTQTSENASPLVKTRITRSAEELKGTGSLKDSKQITPQGSEQTTPQGSRKTSPSSSPPKESLLQQPVSPAQFATSNLSFAAEMRTTSFNSKITTEEELITGMSSNIDSPSSKP